MTDKKVVLSREKKFKKYAQQKSCSDERKN